MWDERVTRHMFHILPKSAERRGNLPPESRESLTTTCGPCKLSALAAARSAHQRAWLATWSALQMWARMTQTIGLHLRVKMCPTRVGARAVVDSLEIEGSRWATQDCSQTASLREVRAVWGLAIRFESVLTWKAGDGIGGLNVMQLKTLFHSQQLQGDYRVWGRTRATSDIALMCVTLDPVIPDTNASFDVL